MSKLQTLEAFRSSFGAEPVETEIQLGKDAPFSIWLRPLTSRARDNFEASVVGVDGERDLANLRARLVSECLCDEEANRIGSPDEIGELRADLIGVIFDKVREVNGMDNDDVNEAGKD